MKKHLFLFILMFLPMLASAQTVSDVQNSGCLNETRGEAPQRVPTIVLTKEGDILSVQLLNYESNCCTEDFNVTSSINVGFYDEPCLAHISVDPIGGYCNCVCPFNVSFTVQDFKPNSFYLDCWWYKGMVELTDGEPLVLEYNNPNTPKYFPEGTKWTEIRLDTLKYDSWYSKVGDEWVPNFETIEYYVKGVYTSTALGENYQRTYTCAYTNGPEWTDSLTLMINEEVTEYDTYIGVMTPNLVEEFALPGTAYQMEWYIGKVLYYRDITSSNATGWFNDPQYGIIEEIKEGVFGGKRPLKYVDMNGVRIIHGIGVTEWKDGECLFGQISPYKYSFFNNGKLPEERHYRSMLVHFERNGEVLYDVWPKKEVAYRPLVEEGKVWTYHYQGLNGREFNVDRIIDGDTIIGGLTYKKIYDKVGGQYQYALREEGKKIYIVHSYNKTASLLYDFSKNAGDIINELTYPLIVASVDTIDIDGVKFRRMRIQDANIPVEEMNTDLIHLYNFWIEGVGSESLLETSIREPGNAYNLLSCKIDGRVYTQQELLGIASKPTPQDDYRPFVEDGKVWKVGQGYAGDPVQVVDYYYFDGDIVIGGKTCKQMMWQQYVNPDYPDYEYYPKSPSKVGAWYEEDKKVYFYDEGQQSMVLKYDFSLEANDTLKFLNVDGYIPFIIGPKQTGGIKGFKGVYRDIMICEEKEQNRHYTTWLEGVGDIEIPTRDIYFEFLEAPYIDLADYFLMSCTVGDEVIYLNDEYEDGATPEGARKHRFDFTHTVKTKPKALRRSGEEQLLYGEYNDLQLGINLDPLDDDYLVRIANESGKVVYEKAVNAGSIVALSIDISAYAKGHYTVTVENSRETFTGEFETQTTGIQELKYSRIEELKSIYNLHGQRLSSLRKGLNIVDGRKIYVK